MSALQDYRVIWQAAFTQRHPTAFKTSVWLIPLVLAGSAVFGLRHDGWRDAIQIALMGSAFVMLLPWVFFFAPGAVLMNSPANARLVPGMHRRLVEMLVAGWVLAGACGLLMFDAWYAAPLSVLWVIGMTAARGGVQSIGFLVTGVSVTWNLWMKTLPAGLLHFLMTLPGFVCSSMAVALVGACAIPLILPAGGERHYQRRQRQTETVVRLESMGRDGTNYVPKRSLSLYAVALRRACRVSDPRRLLLYAVGPSAHWTTPAFASGVVVLIAVAVKILLNAFATADIVEAVAHIGWALPSGLLVMHLVVLEQCKLRIRAAKNEEALLRLAARGPATYEFNACLATELVRNVLLSWFVVTGAALIVTVLTGASQFVLTIETSLCALGLLPSVAWVLRDYSKEDKQGSVLRFIVAIVAVLAFGVVVGVGFAYFRAVGEFASLLLALAVNVMGGAFAVARWRKMVAAPVAFPAGRIVQA